MVQKFKNESDDMAQDETKTPDEILNDLDDAIAQGEQDQENVEIDPIAALNAENQNLSNEVEGLKDRLLRTIAEMENLRKRTEREVSEARSFAIANFARDMLSATDNLSRALVVVPDELHNSEDAAVKSLIDGIKMTEREMMRLLQKNGVKEVTALGEKFNPHIHQAMFEVPNTGKPDGEIVEVVQSGFAIGERILRPAMVGIAKNTNKTAFANESSKKQNGEHIDKKA